jgi:hypothetical protein
MNRRDVLKAAGAVGAIGLLGYGASELYDVPPDDDQRNPGAVPGGSNGTTGPPKDDPPEEPTDVEPSEPDVRHADAYGTVIDAESVGADPTGTQPVNDVIEMYAKPDTLLSFPAGTYRLDPLKLEGVGDFAIASASSERATFVAPAGVCTDRPYLWFKDVSGVLFDGIDVDFTADGAGGEVRFIADGDVTVQNARFSGSCDGQIAIFRIDVIDPDGRALVKNIAAEHDDDRQLTGIYVGHEHAGEVTFEDCDISEFTDNGLYASTPGLDDNGNGPVHVVGGSYTNNNISNVRLGTTGSTARDVHVVIESVPDGYQPNARGIRLRDRRGQIVEDCSVTMGAGVSESFGAIVSHGAHEGGLVRNTAVRVDTNEVPAIHAFRPDRDDYEPLEFENVTVTGDASGSYAATLFGRDGTAFRNCTFQQRGDTRGGIYLVDATGCSIVDSYIETDRNPIVAVRSDVLVQNTTIVTPRGTWHIDNAVLEDGTFNPA